MIYHITSLSSWLKALSDNRYETESLYVEGFIHCSPKEKITETAERFYKGGKDLLILCIDESKVESKIVYEDLYGHGYGFPHIYGMLNLEAVIDVKDLVCGENGLFILPEGI